MSTKEKPTDEQPLGGVSPSPPSPGRDVSEDAAERLVDSDGATWA